MDMGILKPFDTSRTSVAGLSVESVAARSADQKELVGTVALGQAIATQVQGATQQPAELDAAQLESAVSDIQNFVQSVRRDINFQLDDDSGRVVINVTESGSGNIIRQIPSEEALRLAENLSEFRSLLFEAEA